MSEFINRFLSVRYVVKNIWMQIDEINPVIFKHAISLGLKHGESFSQFLSRSRNPGMDTVGFERGDYIANVNALSHMMNRVENTLEEISGIYHDLSEILQIDTVNNPVFAIDDPDGDIMEQLDPKVCLDGLDEAIYVQQHLVIIATRIQNVMYTKGGFHIHDSDNLWKMLRYSRFTVSESINVTQLPEFPPDHYNPVESRQDELVYKMSKDILSSIAGQSEIETGQSEIETQQARKDKIETLENNWRTMRAAKDHQSWNWVAKYREANALAAWRKFTGHEHAIPRANDWTMPVRDDRYNPGDYRRHFTSADEKDANDMKRSTAYKAWADLTSKDPIKPPALGNAAKGARENKRWTDKQRENYLAAEAVQYKKWADRQLESHIFKEDKALKEWNRYRET
jgi:hypothetical protein